MLNTQNMNLDLIRTFVVVGQSKSFNEAAQKLNVDYSNITRHIKALEGLYGAKLIKKDSNLIELTEEGKELFDGYERAYNLLFLTEKSYLQNKNLNNGKITIGIDDDILFDFLDNSIEKFKKIYPDISIKIINSNTNDLYDKLSHYNIDFIIGNQIESKKSFGIVNLYLYKEEFTLLYNKEKYKINDILDLKDVNLILPISSKEERTIFEKILHDNNISKKSIYESYNYNHLYKNILRGDGVGLVPKKVISNDNLINYEIDINKKVYISYIPEYLSPSSKEFLKLIKTLIQE